MRMILAALALTALTGGIAAAPAPEPHPALLTGEYWAHLAPHEKQIYLAGFIAGAAVEQARGEARAAGAQDTTSSEPMLKSPVFIVMGGAITSNAIHKPPGVTSSTTKANVRFQTVVP